jgi:hypothetical protein
MLVGSFGIKFLHFVLMTNSFSLMQLPVRSSDSRYGGPSASIGLVRTLRSGTLPGKVFG